MSAKTVDEVRAAMDTDVAVNEAADAVKAAIKVLGEALADYIVVSNKYAPNPEKINVDTAEGNVEFGQAVHSVIEGLHPDLFGHAVTRFNPNWFEKTTPELNKRMMEVLLKAMAGDERAQQHVGELVQQMKRHGIDMSNIDTLAETLRGAPPGVSIN